MEGEVYELIDALEASKGQPSKDLVLEFLKSLRQSRVSRPHDVLSFGLPVVRSNGASSSEMWVLYEQIFLSALELGKSDVQDKCLNQLRQKFEGSQRVDRLYGMTFENESNYREAISLYEILLEENSANLPAMKRIAACFKALGDKQSFGEQMGSIMKAYPADATSWAELAESYMSVCAFEEAIFCLEELILLAPLTAAYHTRLGEALHARALGLSSNGSIKSVKCTTCYILVFAMYLDYCSEILYLCSLSFYIFPYSPNIVWPH
jgi:tetratricopeptide (TPR) repeat protein